MATALVVAEKAHQVVRDLEQPFRALVVAALRDSADDIIVALRPAWDRAADAVAAGREAFGSVPDDRAIMAAGPTAVAAWGERQEALRTLARIRVTLGFVGYGSREQRASWFVAGVTDADDLARAEGLMYGTGSAFEKLAGAGYVLRLNTAAESVTIESGAKLATEKAEAEARAARVAELRSENAWYLRAMEDSAEPLAVVPQAS